MTSNVLQYLAFAQKSGTRSFSQFFAAMFQLVEGFALSPEEQHLRARLRYVRELFGAGVLESEGLEALDRRIDAVLHDEYFHTALAEILRAGAVHLDALVEPTPGFAPRFSALGLPAIAELEAGDRIDEALADASRRLVALMPREEFTRQLREVRDLRPFGFLRDGSVPPEQSAVFLAFFRSLVCVIALRLLLDRPQAAEAWLAQALAERRLLGSWELLRLLASVPDLAVPVDLVPMESRLDLAAIQARPRWVVVRERLMLHELSGPAAESVAADASSKRPVGPEEAPQSGARPSLAALARRHSSASRTDLRSDDSDFRFGHDDPFASLAKGDG